MLCSFSKPDVHIHLKRGQETHNSQSAPPCVSPAVPFQSPGNRWQKLLNSPGMAVKARPEFPQAGGSQDCEQIDHLAQL